MEGQPPPQPVLLVLRDEDLREFLRLALQEAYRIWEACCLPAALELLTGGTERLVVLLEHQPREDISFPLLQHVAAEESLARRHAYVVLTTLSERLTSEEHKLLADLRVPLVAEPFELEELLDTITHATRHIAGDQNSETVSACQPTFRRVHQDRDK